MFLCVAATRKGGWGMSSSQRLNRFRLNGGEICSQKL